MKEQITEFVVNHSLSQDAEDDLFQLVSLFQTAPPTAEPAPLPRILKVSPEERYRIGELYPRQGAMAEVRRAFDQTLNRSVAIKILPGEGLTDAARAYFVLEAQVTAQLMHSSIVPVHDFGSISDGRLYFTMEEVHGARLTEVLTRRGSASRGLHRLLSAFLRVCGAMDYAHSRGVIHRDLKPDNIWLGRYDEVWLMDWGVARLKADSPIEAISLTESGGTIGSAAYMAPEQQTNPQQADERSDVYALGVILQDILDSAQVGTEDRRTFDDLQGICRQARQPTPRNRHEGVKELAKDISDWLDGTRRRTHALSIASQAQVNQRGAQVFSKRARVLREKAEELLATVEPWEPMNRKLPGWKLEDEATMEEVQALKLEDEAARVLQLALSYQSDLPDVHASLAEHYRQLHTRAEADGDGWSAQRFEHLLQFHDRTGAHTHYLRGFGSLRLDSRPTGAAVRLYRYVEVDRVLHEQIAVEIEGLKVTPLTLEGLKPGSYLLVLTRLDEQSGPQTRYPFVIRRCEDVCLEQPIRLLSYGEMLEGFVHVPAGVVWTGGDPTATNSWERERRWVGDFAIARHPVTVGEYQRFIDALHACDPEEAWSRSPHGADKTPLWFPDADSGAPKFPELDPEEDPWDSRWPVFGIRWEDAAAYCAWLSQETGFRCRLLTETEWEKAARGADQRIFPWGSFFDPTFCKMGLSRPGRKLPEPVGTFPQDCSPYGVFDMSGTISTWCDGWVDESHRLRPLRGGAWSFPPANVRAARRKGVLQATRSLAYGFRMAHDVD